ncbi:MAG: lasso peptide [Richelia sp. RM2_1_2]|nr:lasso peptide [Richelia sp. RM2_1_2]
MTFQKKNYAQPQLVVHGNVETITQQGGGNSTDVPIGTPVTPTTTIADITGMIS